MPEDFKRRLPAVEKPVSEIKQDVDVRVRVLGTVIGLTEGSVLVDDGSGKIEVFFDDPNQLAGLREGQMVRVVTRILPLIEGFECRGECVQDMNGFDLGTYKEARKIVFG